MITVHASFARVPAKASGSNLSKTDWAVLHALCLHSDKDGRAFPSMARIADIAGIKRNHVPRSMRRLEAKGLLRRERVPRPTGGWQVSHYELLFEPLGDVTTTGDTRSEPVTATGDTPHQPVTIPGDTPPEMSPRGVTGCHHWREQGVTSSGALTDYLTDQGTDLAKEGRVEEGESAAGGTSSGDTCRWPLGTGCTRLAMYGKRLCIVHEARR